MELTRALSFHIPVLFLLGALFISSSTLLTPSLCMGGGTSWGVPIVVYTQCHSHAIRVEGGVVVIGPRPTQMIGLVRGDLFVRDGSVCEMTGMVTGNLLAERTGKVVLKGLVNKDAKAVGGDLEVYGMVVGNVVNEGGRVYVDKQSLVKGRVIGEVSDAPLPPPAAAPKPATPSAPPAPPSPPPSG